MGKEDEKRLIRVAPGSRTAAVKKTLEEAIGADSIAKAKEKASLGSGDDVLRVLDALRNGGLSEADLQDLKNLRKADAEAQVALMDSSIAQTMLAQGKSIKEILDAANGTGKKH